MVINICFILVSTILNNVNEIYYSSKNHQILHCAEQALLEDIESKPNSKVKEKIHNQIKNMFKTCLWQKTMKQCCEI
jgi:hypothetical protein